MDEFTLPPFITRGYSFNTVTTVTHLKHLKTEFLILEVPVSIEIILFQQASPTINPTVFGVVKQLG